MSGALAAARREAEEWLAGYDDTVAALPPGRVDTPEVRLLRALLAAEREAEADVARLTRAHGGCDAQVRTLVSKGLAAIRKAEAAQSALAEDPARRFGLLALAAWWNEGQPGDLEGDVLQGYADRAGLWHHVDRHAAGVECEWCGNDGSGCGELTDAGERAWAEAESMPVRSVPSRIDELTVLLRECNAVCLCGCPESEHESYGEDGESCGDEKHECIRVAPAVLEIVQRYRVALSDALAQKPAGAEVREAAEAQFGRALLPLWWDDGNPGDIDGSAAQDAAEASGLWRRVERHADGVECEWCNNEEPCGELTDTGLAALRGGQKGEGR